MNFDEIEWNPLDYMCRCTIEPPEVEKMSKRFDIIGHCSSECALLIDKWNELPSIPLGFSLDMLDEEDTKGLNKWLDFLNDGKKDTVQTKLTEVK
jgi:hypothetical protein